MPGINELALAFNILTAMVRFLKTLLTCSLLFGLSLSNFSLNAQVPTDKLIGYYPFNGNANDESGNGHHGAVTGAQLNYDRFGTAFKSYSFNGTSDHIVLSDNFDVIPRTISLWLNASDTQYRDRYGSVYVSDNPLLLNGNAGIAIRDINGVKKLLLTTSVITDTFNCSISEWHHAVIVSNSINEVCFYVDGKLIGKHYIKDKLCSADGINKAIVGSDRLTSKNYFKGLIDDIRIYNKALSGWEVNKLFTENSYYKKNYQTFSVYPNPGSGQFNISFGSDFESSDHYSFRICNSIGQHIYSDRITSKHISLDLSSKVSKGLYILYILDSKNRISMVQKLAIQ